MFSGVALVTGAASGIGAATVQSFIRKGVKRLVLADLSDKLASIAAELSSKHNVETLPVSCDISDESSVKALMDAAVKQFGRIDYAANCAGITGPLAPVTELSAADWDKTLAVNARGVFLCTAAEIRLMATQSPLDTDLGPTRAQRGAIVNVASALGMKGRPDVPAYSASKAAVIALGRSATLENALQKIRINTVAPGIVESPMTAGSPLLSVDSDPSITPIGRAGRPEEIADVITYLCSEEASYVLGATWLVDGGQMAH